MEIKLSNGNLCAVITSNGAELISLKLCDGKEYIDNGSWSNSTPILFPICGGLRDGKYIYGGKQYECPKHGFCRNVEFEVEDVNDTSATLSYSDNEDTRKMYPFLFKLSVIFTLTDDGISVVYKIDNRTDGEMYFSIGAHESYSCPGGVEGYTLTFDKSEDFDSHKVEGVLLSYEKDKVADSGKSLTLKKSFFDIDALCFSKINSDSVILESPDKSRSVKLTFGGASHFLIWTDADENLPFVCLEPWCGFPDMTDSDYDFTKKQGIKRLGKGESFEYSHTISIIK